MTTTINYDPSMFAKVKTKPSTMRKSKAKSVFSPAVQEILTAQRERIAELEGHLSGKSSNSILSEAEHLTTQDRNDAYGHPAVQFGKVAAAFNAMTGHRITRKQAITFMMILKMVRENFNPKRDNRVDLCGYANCLDMTQQAEDQGLLDEFTTGSQPGRPVAAGLHGAGETEKDRPSVPVEIPRKNEK